MADYNNAAFLAKDAAVAWWEGDANLIIMSVCIRNQATSNNAPNLAEAVASSREDALKTSSNEVSTAHHGCS